MLNFTFKFFKKDLQPQNLLPFPTFSLFEFSLFPAASGASRRLPAPSRSARCPTGRQAGLTRLRLDSAGLPASDRASRPDWGAPPPVPRWGLRPQTPRRHRVSGEAPGFAYGHPGLRRSRRLGGPAPRPPAGGYAPGPPASLRVGSSPRLATRLRRSARSSLGSAQPRLRPTSGLRQAELLRSSDSVGGRRRAWASDSLARRLRKLSLLDSFASAQACAPASQASDVEHSAPSGRFETRRASPSSHLNRPSGSECSMQIFQICLIFLKIFTIYGELMES